MLVNPNWGVGVGEDPCWTPAKIMSFWFAFVMVADVPPLFPLLVPGSPVLRSKGLLKLAPVMPKTCSPLYSPPYCVLAQPDIDSVIVSEFNVPVLFAHHS